MYFTIDADNNVTAHAAEQGELTWQSLQALAGDNGVAFRSEIEFQNATAEWPLSRLVELWNSFAGVAPFSELKPVKKFENRGIATARIWRTIQKLAPAAAVSVGQAAAAPEPDVQSQPGDDEMATKTAKTKAGKASKKASGRAQGAAKASAAKPAAKTTTPAPREGTRKETIMNLIGRKNGATLQEIMAATGWQAHSVRGFIATLGTKHGVQIASSKNDAGERVYQAALAGGSRS